ncbi:uncharacterized protein LOC134535950 isoform X2 [Bacillus rossius redtenbacheri]|uniref:uncharacterized protein LOC134535950 isoform X2 n=1 Tax=Bacillus rossius redtenbacheri TaxID=93214 RepID=UPI002FDE0821
MLLRATNSSEQSQMLTMVQARQQGRENIVRRMLVAYREQRHRSRLPNHAAPAAGKRRRLAPRCAPSTPPRQLPAILPQPSRQAPMANVTASSPVRAAHTAIGSSAISSSTPSLEQPPQLAPLTWQYQQYQSAWFANASAVSCGQFFTPTSDYQAVPLDGILNQGIITTRMQPTLLPSQPCQTSFARHSQINQYFDENLMSRQSPMYPDSVMQLASQAPPAMMSLPYGYETGLSSAMHEPFFPAYGGLSPGLAESALYGPGPVWGPTLQGFELAMGLPEGVDLRASRDFALSPAREEGSHQPCYAACPSPLDAPVDTGPPCDIKPEFPCLGSNVTSTFRCYTRPICSVRSSQESMLTLASLPLSGLGDDEDEDIGGCCDEGCCGGGPCGSPGEDPPPTPLYTQFRHDDKLSLPLIYHYIASTEEMLLGQQQQQQQQQPQLQEEIVSQSVSSPAVIVSMPAAIVSSPEVIVSSPEVIAQLPSEKDSSPVQREVASSSVQVSSASRNIPNKLARSPCCYRSEGCLKQLVRDVLGRHETVCPYRPVSCPLRDCFWKGKMKFFEDHLRQIHTEKIVRGLEGSHVIPLAQIREEESMHFIQETDGKIYVISAHYIGHLLRITLQAVVVDKMPPYMKGSLEVVGSDGRPYGWWGGVHAFGRSLLALWDQGMCLAVDLEAVGTLDGCVTVHSTVFLGTPPARKSHRKGPAAAGKR